MAKPPAGHTDRDPRILPRARLGAAKNRNLYDRKHHPCSYMISEHKHKNNETGIIDYSIGSGSGIDEWLQMKKFNKISKNLIDSAEPISIYGQTSKNNNN